MYMYQMWFGPQFISFSLSLGMEFWDLLTNSNPSWYLLTSLQNFNYSYINAGVEIQMRTITEMWQEHCHSVLN